MKDRRLRITIEKPVSDVFAYTINPANTHKWIEGIVVEETNDWPPSKGTVYRNKSHEGVWNEYTMTELEQDKTFTLSRLDGRYHVRYTFEPINATRCGFEYYEWVETGELDDTFSQEVLEKLRDLIEQQ